MDISIRSCLTAGVATITAAAIIFVPSVAETPPPAAPPAPVHVVSPPIKLTAQVQPVVTATDLPGLLVEWLQRIIVPPSASQPVPTPQFPPVVAPTSIGSSIKSAYNAVEPWVQWGFDLAAYAIGWVPYVGLLAPPDHDLSTTSANASRAASRSTSPTGSTGTSASSRDWSTSASTPSTRSSSWPMTN